MKKILMIVGVVMAMMIANTAKSQSLGQTYNTALGVKLWGDGGGITIKHFVGNNNALEGIGYFWQNGMRITGLYEFHYDIAGAPGLKWYVGPGAHVSLYRSEPNSSDGSSGSSVGIDGVLGLDYKFNKAPINLSLDWQPSMEFGNGRGFYGGWGGLGIRYTF